MNLSKELKKKRDAEKRLEQNSPMPVFIGGSGGNSDAYITNQQIINKFNTINNLIQQIIDGGGAVGGGYFEPLTTGDTNNPELLFADGDILMVEVI